MKHVILFLDLNLNEWHTDKSSGVKSRQVSYTVALNHSMGPKSCGVTEKQVQKLKKPIKLKKVLTFFVFGFVLNAAKTDGFMLLNAKFKTSAYLTPTPFTSLRRIV